MPRQPQSNLAVRQAENSDLAGIMRLQAASYTPALQEPESMFAQILKISAGTCFIAESEATVAGYLLTHPVPDDYTTFGKGIPELQGNETTLYIHDLCVGPDFRGRGVAQLLLNTLKSTFNEQGKIKTFLGVAVQNSESFWAAQGFTIGKPYIYPGGSSGFVMTHKV